MPPPVKKHGDGETDHAAVTRHPAVPNSKDGKRIGQRLSRSIKEHVTESPTGDHAQRRRENEVAHLVRWQSAIAALRQPAQEEKTAEESEEIRESVPANTEARSEFDHERTEIIEIICDQSGSSLDQATDDAEKKVLPGRSSSGQGVRA